MPKLLNKPFITIIFFVLALSACEQRPKNVLNERTMTAVLVDMHLLEGTLDTKGIGSSQFDLKSKYFNSILEKYNINQADFDSSVVWYTKNPKTYADIYINVNKQLIKLQNEIKKGKYHSVDSTDIKKFKLNIWNKPISYHFTKDSTRTQLNFEIVNAGLMYGDVYILKFKEFISRQDSCTDRFVVLRINYYNGATDSVFTKTYNDGLTKRYTIQLPAYKKLKIKSISGKLLGCKTYKGTFHAVVDSISLTRMFNSLIQDSLRKVVQKVDPTNYLTPDQKRMNSILLNKSNLKNNAIKRRD